MGEKGFTPIILVAVLVMLGISGAVYWKFGNQTKVLSPQSAVSTRTAGSSASAPPPSPTIVPKVGTIPTVDCLGPDGRHAQMTEVDCDKLNKAWATPTPNPTSNTKNAGAVTGCSAYNLGGNLGSLTVNIVPESGQTLSGDAGVTIDHTYNCPSVDPGFPYIQVIKQGSASVNFGGMRPGPFHVDVQYHGHTSGYDVNISSGMNSIIATVSN